MPPPVRLPRRLLAALGLACACALPLAAQSAPPPMPTDQVPGYYRLPIGDMIVTALYDGYVDLDPGILIGATEQDVQTLLARMFLASTPGVQTAVNAYLVHTDKRLILVDAGAGQCFGKSVGGLAGNIRAAGYEPDQIDTVLLTHLHADHACGLLDNNGEPLFANADVYAARAEADYWLNPSAAAAAPEEARPMFELARQSVEPYRRQDRFMTYRDGDSPVPGVTIVATPGHTPGHTSYLFRSGQRELLIWGDIVHNHAVQFSRPEVAIEFDTDPTQAIATRRAVFADAAQHERWIAGAHLPFPGLGHVRRDGQAYTWVPAEYAPLRNLPSPP